MMPRETLLVTLVKLFVLRDVHYNTSELQQHCQQRGHTLVTTQYSRYSHTGPEVEMRRLFHKLRSTAIENFNEQFKGIFSAHEQVPTKGEGPTKRFALEAVLLYQIALWYRHEQKLGLRVGAQTLSEGCVGIMKRPRLIFSQSKHMIDHPVVASIDHQ